MRAAFYYPWYGPPDDHWPQGHRYNSGMGEYDSGNPFVIDNLIGQMQYALIEAGIYSWWGKDSPTDNRFQAHLDKAFEKGFKFCIYYELDWNAQRPYKSWWPWTQTIKKDLEHISQYFSHPAYLKQDCKPVVFVYQPTGGGPDSIAKWTQAKEDFGLYVNMSDVPEWFEHNTLDGWHRYDPAQRATSVYLQAEELTVYSITVSAGFWAAWEPEARLERSLSEWHAIIPALEAYEPDWFLVYFNEMGEGTDIDFTTEWQMDYLTVLKDSA